MFRARGIWAAGMVAALLAGAAPVPAAAQETICARTHTKIFAPLVGREECVEIDRSLHPDSQALQEQRQRVLERRIDQQRLIRETRARLVREQAETLQRQVQQQQDVLLRQRQAEIRQRRLVTEQRALLMRLRAEQSRAQ